MPEETMLAHLSRRLGSGPENLATEALAFLLQTPAVSAGLLRHARTFAPGLAAPVAYRTQDWSADDQAIPDLVGTSGSGSAPLIIEAKFAAALTPNQPVTYLQRLRELAEPSLLLFLVPTRRVHPVWDEIRRRCAEAGVVIESEGTVARGSSGSVTVAVTSWRELLASIDQELVPATDYQRQRAELEQLQGLCDREDQNTFRPFTSDFLHGDVGRRVNDLDELLIEAVDVLVAAEVASVAGLRYSAGHGWFGRYLKLAGWECRLGVEYGLWDRYAHPMWLWISDRRAGTHTLLSAELEVLANLHPPRLIRDEGRLVMPVVIPHEAERDAVFAAIEQQVRELAEILQRVRPDGDESALDLGLPE